MKIKDWDIKLCNDWLDFDDLINIELLTFHLQRNFITKRVELIWVTLLGFTFYWSRGELEIWQENRRS